jgi:hypothetical protein
VAREVEPVLPNLKQGRHATRQAMIAGSSWGYIHHPALSFGVFFLPRMALTWVEPARSQMQDVACPAAATIQWLRWFAESCPNLTALGSPKRLADESIKVNLKRMLTTGLAARTQERSSDAGVSRLKQTSSRTSRMQPHETWTRSVIGPHRLRDGLLSQRKL